MMTPNLSTLEGQKGTAIETNGQGKRYWAHLNRSVTLATVWGIPPRLPKPRPPKAAKPRPVVPLVLVPRPAPPPPYAGYDAKEDRW